MAMTGREIADLLNREGMLTIGELTIGVRVLDARTVWGDRQYQVEPLTGSGSQWVKAYRVNLA